MFLYTLADPRTGEIRYLGKTKMSLSERLYTHIYRAITFRDNTPKDEWLRELHTAGERPVLTVVEDVTAADWQERERFWIASLKGSLLNCRRGGYDMGDAQNYNGRPMERPQPLHLRHQCEWLTTTSLQLPTGEVVQVDAEDYSLLSPLPWHRNGDYVATSDLAKSSSGRKKILMHQVLMGIVEGCFIDHINGNGFDNRKANLRVCTRGQNAQNSKVREGRQFKGVHYYKAGKRYQAYIQKEGKAYPLGYWDTAEEAARCYDRAAVFLFGEFAKTNFPVDFDPPQAMPSYPKRRAGGKPRTFRNETHKECCICHQTKPRGEFSRSYSTAGADPHETRCRCCNAARRNLYPR